MNRAQTVAVRTASGGVDLATALWLVAAVALLLGDGCSATTAFALTWVRQVPEAEFVEAGSHGLTRAWETTERLGICLAGRQLGITACRVGAGVVAEPALAAVVDPLVVAAGPTPPSAHTPASRWPRARSTPPWASCTSRHWAASERRSVSPTRQFETWRRPCRPSLRTCRSAS